MNKKKFISIFVILALTALLGTISYLTVDNQPDINVEKLNDSSQKMVNPIEERDVGVERVLISAPDNTIVEGVENNSDLSISDKEMFEIIEWNKTRGYFNKEDPYEGYDFETLIRIANTDDPLAQFDVAKQFLIKGDIKSAIKFNILASINGFTSSLVALSNIQMNKYYTEKNNNDDSAQRSLLTSYAYLEVAKKRGDINAKLLLDSYLTSISKDDLDEINHISNDIYNQFQSARKNKGMQDFDNSVPDGLWKVYQISKKTQQSLMSSLRK